jgi:hypothetical protein
MDDIIAFLKNPALAFFSGKSTNYSKIPYLNKYYSLKGLGLTVDYSMI